MLTTTTTTTLADENERHLDSNNNNTTSSSSTAMMNTSTSTTTTDDDYSFDVRSLVTQVNQQQNTPIVPSILQQKYLQHENHSNTLYNASSSRRVTPTGPMSSAYGRGHVTNEDNTTIPTTDSACCAYDDDNMSSTTICDEDEVVLEESDTNSNVSTTGNNTTIVKRKQQHNSGTNNNNDCTTTGNNTTVSSSTVSISTTITARSSTPTRRKRLDLGSIIRPFMKCFVASPKSNASPASTKRKSMQITAAVNPAEEEKVEVIDVETEYEATITTTTTTTTTTATIPTASPSSGAVSSQQKKLKKKKKRKPRKSESRNSRAYSIPSDHSHNKATNQYQYNGMPNNHMKALLPPQCSWLAGRKTLVLDLDETLVHSKFEPVEGADFEIPINIEGREHIVYVMKRPGVDIFLEQMSKHFELVVFTASLSKYANPLLDRLDPKGFITGRLFREHCTYIDQCYVKDMSRLGRDVDCSLIIDNSPACYSFQPRNAMPCTSWFDDQSDSELLLMIPWLQKLAGEKDVYATLEQWRGFFAQQWSW